jgi:hypothetical protein
MTMQFDTKVAILVLDKLAVWQKLNVTAFLATGIAAAAPDAIGKPYVDPSGRTYAALLGEPVMILSATSEVLARACRQAIDRDLACAACCLQSLPRSAPNAEPRKPGRNWQ